MTRITAARPTHGRAPSHSPPDVLYAPKIGIARGLGWFSIGLGLAESLAPRQMSQITGVHRSSMLKAGGLREIITGVGILTSRRPTWWMWGRVAGDVLDLAVLAEAAINDEDACDRSRALAATAVVAGVTALDAVVALGLTAAQRMEG